MGWYPCCCKKPACQYCTATPTQLQVVISGVVDQDCSDCDSLNGTFTLDQVDGNACQWNYDNDSLSTCFTNESYTAEIYLQSGTTYFLWVRYIGDTGGSGGTIEWLENLGTTKPDCSAWSSQSVSYHTDTISECDGTSATCAVTAL